MTGASGGWGWGDAPGRTPLRPARWSVILAGGDGTRLRPLTERLAGDARPKQFCAVLGQETLLEETRRRAAMAVSPHRTLVVVTRPHEAFYAPLLADVWSRQLVIQPENRGTAPAILYALLRLAPMAPTDPVAILPSDHYVSDEERFMAHVGAAFEAATARPDLVVLLGIAPDAPQHEYGWIEPAEPIVLPRPSPWPLYRVRRFWEKPAPALARMLRTGGCLWNSFVTVGRVGTLIRLIKRAAPDLYRAFAPVRPVLHTFREDEAVRAVYAASAGADFSRQVLTASPGSLAVLPVSGVGWNDLGDPGRVMTTRRQLQGVGVAGGTR